MRNCKHKDKCYPKKAGNVKNYHVFPKNHREHNKNRFTEKGRDVRSINFLNNVIIFKLLVFRQYILFVFIKNNNIQKYIM